jgi:hypothetical protein
MTTYNTCGGGTIARIGITLYAGPAILAGATAIYPVYWQPTGNYAGTNPNFALAIGDQIYLNATWSLV